MVNELRHIFKNFINEEPARLQGQFLNKNILYRRVKNRFFQSESRGGNEGHHALLKRDMITIKGSFL
jgi:hypothetical protein